MTTNDGTSSCTFKLLQEALSLMPEIAAEVTVIPLNSRLNCKYNVQVPVVDPTLLMEKKSGEIHSKSPTFYPTYCSKHETLYSVAKSLVLEMCECECNKPAFHTVEAQNYVWCMNAQFWDAVFKLTSIDQTNEVKTTKYFYIKLSLYNVEVHYSDNKGSVLSHVVNHPVVVKLNKLCQDYKHELVFILDRDY